MRRRAVTLAGVVFALAGTAVATEQLASRARPPAEATVTIAATAPLFNAEGLVGGEQLERCTVLTNLGPQPADVTLFGSASEAALSPWLPFELVRGTLPVDTPPGDCTGFVPDSLDYGAGTPGVVFTGTLASFPADDAGIADPTRWAAGESHAYQLRIGYTGGNAQQGLRTVQDFHWGSAPFDDRPDEAAAEPAPGAGPLATTPPAAIPEGRQCTELSFGTRGFVVGRAISKPKQITKKPKKKQASRKVLGFPEADLVRDGEDAAALGLAELERRARLLQTTRASAARQLPMLVVRLQPKNDRTLSVRVGLRRRGKLYSPKRWRWVRVRLNAGSTKSKLQWPFNGTARITQLKTGYNQIDIALDRGRSGTRVKGLPRVLKRSFAFIVHDSGKSGPSAGCQLG